MNNYFTTTYNNALANAYQPYYGLWSNWLPCQNCDHKGIGIQYKYKPCYDPLRLNRRCTQTEGVQVRQCKCGENDINGNLFSIWGPWSGCSEKCGGGVQTRTRTCISPYGCFPGMTMEERRCNTQPCQGINHQCTLGILSVMKQNNWLNSL